MPLKVRPNMVHTSVSAGAPTPLYVTCHQSQPTFFALHCQFRMQCTSGRVDDTHKAVYCRPRAVLLHLLGHDCVDSSGKIDCVNTSCYKCIHHIHTALYCFQASDMALTFSQELDPTMGNIQAFICVSTLNTNACTYVRLLEGGIGLTTKACQP